MTHLAEMADISQCEGRMAEGAWLSQTRTLSPTCRQRPCQLNMHTQHTAHQVWHQDGLDRQWACFPAHAARYGFERLQQIDRWAVRLVRLGQAETFLRR